MAPPGDTSEDEASSWVGRTIDGLRIDALLGRGGMGEVYKAFDPRLQRPVALKAVSALYAADREFAARFLREARSASAVNHPNVAQIFSSGEFAGRPYYVMELVDGQSLADILDQSGHLTGRRSLELLLQAAQGLGAAAEAGIVHRDIKPANLMLDAKGRLKIVDFGLARRSVEDLRLTRTDFVVGTPTYVAPEQAQGLEIDHRADIYALGATFYHLLAGAPPFVADTPVALVMKHVHEALPPLRARNPRVPVAVAALVERMLSKDPDQRPATYEELIAEVEALLQGRPANSAGLAPTLYRPPAAVAGPAPAARFAWRLPAIIGVVVVLVIVGFIARRRSAVPEATQARGPERSATGGESAPESPTEILERVRAGGAIDPQVAYRLAYQTETLANLRRLSTAIEVYHSQEGNPETSPGLEQIAQMFGVPARSLKDGWGRDIRYEPREGASYRLASAGADGQFETADDIVVEDGEITKGGIHGPVPGLPAGLAPPPRADEPSGPALPGASPPG